MIKLNSPKYNNEINKDDILRYISDYDIFKYYIPELSLGVIMHSPLRRDENPSFGVFWSKKYNMLMFKDQSTGERGDVFVFVSRLFNINYNKTLLQIITDFNLGEEFGIFNLIPNKKPPKIHNKDVIDKVIKSSVDIKIKIRDWEEHDILFWKNFGVSLKTLKKYKVFPTKYIFINDDIIISDKYSYAFTEVKDGVVRFKIYQPYSQEMKWINNMLEGTLSGWSQLPKTGKYLIITSSLKDALCLHDLGYTNVIAPQTENYIFKPHIIADLKSRFDNLIIFYDEDAAGNLAADRMKTLFGIPNISTKNADAKDPSDYYKSFGKTELKTLIKTKLKEL